MSDVNLLISVACARDLDIWKITHPFVLRHISASRYQILVPKEDLALFRAHTSSLFEVLAQEGFLNSYNKLSIANWLPDRFKGRAGWYMQQFAKLNALRQGYGDDVNVTWDSDTLPLTDIKYIQSGKLYFYIGGEFHRPYFTTIKSLLGLRRMAPFSFVAPTLPSRGRWANQMCDTIELLHNCDWITAVLKTLPQINQSEFSECETLGTYAVNNYPSEIRFSHNAWEHNGYSVIGDPGEAGASDLSRAAKLWDFIVFEKYFERRGASQQLSADWLRASLRKLIRQAGVRSLAIRLRNSIS